MKKTQLIDLLQNIKASIVSFVSIALFVSLGVALFLGINDSVVRLENATDRLYQDSDYHHFSVSFPYGLDDGDLAALEAIDGIDLVAPAYVSYQTHDTGGLGKPVALHSIPEGMDALSVVEGRLPETPDEVVVGHVYAELVGLSVGDDFTLLEDAQPPLDGGEPDPDGMAYLTRPSFTVVGLIESPEYITETRGAIGFSTDGATLEGIAYLLPSAFDPDAFLGTYPMAYLRAESLLPMHTFSSAYKEASGAIEERIVALGEERAPLRYEKVHGEAQAAYDEAAAQIADGERQLDDAATQIEEGDRAIETGEIQLEAAIQQLESGQASYETTRDQGETMLSVMEQSLSQLQAASDAANAALDSNRSRVDTLAAEVDSVASEISTLRTAVDDGIAELRALDEELAGGRITGEQYAEQRQAIVDRINMAVSLFKLAASTLFPQIAERFPALMEFPEIVGEPSAWIEAATSKLAEYDGYASGAREMLSQAQSELAGVKDQAEALAGQLSDGWSRYNGARQRFDDAMAAAASQLDSGRTQIEEGQTTLEEKAAELEEGRQLIGEKTAELEEGKQALEAARVQLDAMQPMGWIVRDRSHSTGMLALDNTMSLSSNLRVVLASLFIIVGILVCYSAISRIVHEQITRIGTKKALGFRPSEVTASFLGYTGLAVIVGTILGIAVSVLVVQGIYYTTLAASYDLAASPPVLQPLNVVVIFALEMALLLGITWLACRSVLTRSAVSLLAGEQTASGRTRFYERWPVWHKLPLLTQTVINNCVNDPRRVFATVVGVASCTALIVTAITLDDNIKRSLRDHFGTVYFYDSYINFDPNEDGAAEKIRTALDEAGCGNTLVHGVTMLREGGEDFSYSFVYVPSDEEEFSRFFHMDVVKAGGTAPAQGAWVSRSFADHLGAKVGDTLSLGPVGAEPRDVRIAGFFNFYLSYSCIVMSPSYYEQVFGHAPVYNCYLVSTEGVGFDAMQEAVSGIDGITFVADEKAIQEDIAGMFTSLTSVVVAVYVALAAIMAAMVLLNLDYMFIDEKKRELIVLMINGYSVKDAKAYIYRDAILMTVLGIILGLGLGIAMGSATVAAVEWQSVSFMKGPDLKAILIGAGLSALFAATMMLIALRRIPRFSLTDISKF